ncbi:MAG: hypothetical protein RMJ43_05240 [Chloroherpetonaceae bacterium]|nr:hypothetical protein [Chthonomonadaceae bacterium]MDW8207219.1 hypothetical protein [Chloroherpetonaceae bacterium]
MRYTEWNQQLIAHFTTNVPHGTPIFLTVDLPTLQDIAIRNGIDPEDAERAFCDAVRQEIVVRDNREICLEALRYRDADGRPRGVAFLGLMVLAAHNMGDQEASEQNYFTQLRHLLRLAESRKGRPKGMSPGENAEEPLWKEWQRYLERIGFAATARRGPEGSRKYINYPLSQALLRCADRARLRKHFCEYEWFRTYREPDLLMARLIAQRDVFSKYLQERLNARGDRYAALMDTIHALHQAYLQEGSASAERARNQNLMADLIRYPGGFQKPPTYKLLPRLRHAQEFDAIRVHTPAGWEPLERDPENAGYGLPVGVLRHEEIVDGVEYEIDPPYPYRKLQLLKRPFHILVCDPNDPESGIYQTGRNLATDIHFILIGPSEVLEQMRRLRDLGILQWSQERPLGTTGWIELVGCMILDQDWSRVLIGDTELLNALRPRQSLTIGLTGGLRAPGSRDYLAGFGPTITLYGTIPDVSIRCYRILETREDLVWEGRTRPHEPVTLPDAIQRYPGRYRLEAGDGDPEQKLFTVVDRDSLRRSARTLPGFDATTFTISSS